MKKFLWIICSLVFLFGCKKENINQKDECTVELSQPFANPYLLPDAAQLNENKATHKYVRFHIYNSKQYQTLEQQGVVLLDHPFDAIPNKNLIYKTTHTKDYAIFYGVVPIQFQADAVPYETLQYLSMPDASTNNRISDASAKQFSGKITFFDPIRNSSVPLAGVQVIIKDATKISTGFSDSNGDFSITPNGNTSDTVEVLIKFDNNYYEIHTLDAANILNVIGINTFSLGFRKSCAFTQLNIDIGSAFNNAALHHSCAALLALNQFKTFAAAQGFLMPTGKMLIWLGKDAPISTSYATPMLQNMSDQNISNITQLMASLLGVDPTLAAVIVPIIKDQLPDIYAPYYSTYSTVARKSFIETLYHELSHSCHYAKVGPAFWLPYVQYIYQNGGYGNPSLPNSGIVSLSEAWAEDLSNIGLNYTYQQASYLNLNENSNNDWIPYGLYYDLYDTGNNEAYDQVSSITFPEIYALFDVNVTSLAILKSKLKAAYPSQQTYIDFLFAHYGY